MKILSVIIAVITITGFFIYPKSCLDACSYAVSSNSLILISSLFPSFVCAKIFIKSNFIHKLSKFTEPFTQKFFNIGKNGNCAFLLGILSGYPMGAVCACNLYKNRQISKSEAEKLNCFCNNSSPVFVIMSVGVCIFNSLTYGILLFCAHILSAITIGILFKNYIGSDEYNYIPYNFKRDVLPEEKNIIGASIKEAYELILYVIGFVIFFKIFLNILTECGFFSILNNFICSFILSKEIITPLIFGIFEIFNGITHMTVGIDTNINLLIASFLLGFGGLSIFLQIFGITENYGFSKKLFIKAKFFQASISVFYMLIFIKIYDITFFSNNFSSTFFEFLYVFITIFCCIWASRVVLRKIRRFVIKQ